MTQIDKIMGIKYIHVTLIVVSILLALGFGFWALNHEFMAWGYGSFAMAVGLIVYCLKFIRKMKAL
jgi:hypothetical protein